MRVDVHDVAGSKIGFAKCLGHGQRLTCASRVRLDHVVRIGGDAGSGELAVDTRTAPVRVPASR